MPVPRPALPSGQRRRRSDALLLSFLLALTYLLSAAWSLRIPLPFTIGDRHFFPDELSHVSVARYIARWGALPPYRFPFDTSVHPPLYHGLAALLLVLLRPLGGLGALLAVRLATGLCGVGVVYLTYRAARHFGTRRFALSAAALVALIPTRVVVGGGITNENLAALGAAGALAVLVGGMHSRGGFTRRRIALLAVYLAVGIGSKLTCLGLIPAAVVAIVWQGRRQGRAWPIALLPALVPPGVVAAAWGWWFARNQRLYGDPWRKAAADRMWNPRQPGYAYYHAQHGLSPLLYVRALIHSGWESFWGSFNGSNLPGFVYVALALFQIVAFVGLCRSERFGLWFRKGRASWKTVAGFVAVGYCASVAAVYFAYNWSHYTPQGRYFFVTLLPFGVATAVGWRSALRPLAAPGRVRLTALLLALLVALNAYCLWVMPGRSG